MGRIINRRNAVLGWAVWKITKAFGKQKAKEAVPGPGSGTQGPDGVLPARREGGRRDSARAPAGAATCSAPA